MNKPVKIVFTVSLILNVLFLGLAAGGILYHSREAQRPWEKMKKELASETRDVIKTTFKGKKEDFMPLFIEARVKKEALKSVLIAPEFDGDVYDAFAGEFRILNGQLMDNRLSAIKSIFSKLPQEERVKIADHTVEKILGKPPHSRKGRIGTREDGYSPHSGINSSGRIDKKGAIRAERGRTPFDARRVSEGGANHED